MHAHTCTHSRDLKELSGVQCHECSDNNFSYLLIVFAAEAKHVWRLKFFSVDTLNVVELYYKRILLYLKAVASLFP
jgi:hypothetical protein